jgi:hypothetical protein
MNTPAQIKARFGYMFAGPVDGDSITLQVGWVPIVERLCEEIDTLLGEEKYGFHWTHIGYGYRDELDRLQFRFEVDFTADMHFAIRHLIARATNETIRTCMVCGCQAMFMLPSQPMSARS